MHVLEQTGTTVSVNGMGNHSLSLLKSQSINNIVFSFWRPCLHVTFTDYKLLHSGNEIA